MKNIVLNFPPIDSVIVAVIDYLKTRLTDPTVLLEDGRNPADVAYDLVSIPEQADAPPTVPEPTPPSLANVGHTPEQVAQMPPGGPVDIDNNGVPWDHRIHSSSKKKTAKGVWARRKNLTDEFFNQVIAELKAAMGVQTPPPAPPVQTPPAAPQVQAPAAGTAQDVPKNYVELTQYVIENDLDLGKCHEVAVGLGLANYNLLANRPDLIPAFFAGVTA